MKKNIRFVAAFLLVTVFTASAWTVIGEPVRRPVALIDQTGQGASGEVLFERMDFMPGLSSMGITAYNLRPGSAYSVWFSDGKGTLSPAGVETNTFRTDGSGKGRYVTTVYEDVLDDWRYIVINLHPDGDPANTKEMKTALRGDLDY